ncbi:preprotein translocase subunit YajC [Lactobacillus sp. S2-2]|uniref:preprotein translocase subunit YajC n=1 Tax=Lactobacillus sp. S2-2 TaxID=2692917 RepID=UPI001EFF67B3|nr:preprotein translocase subunit YajC [Lactobacillus sp. S2-2]MCF6515807.1 preprotein translocase subunit YajC [Lactobacillus sp. S2-2]
MPSQYGSFIVIIVLFVLMYFLMIRPQRKQQQKHQETLKSLEKGDKVVTIGRLHGVVDEIDQTNRTVTLDCDGIYLVFDLNAIASSSKPSQATVEETKTEEKDDEE